MSSTLEQSICDVVTENPAAAGVFENLDIEYYRRGASPLGEVLAESGMALEEFVSKLDQAAVHDANPAGPDWRVAPLRMLIRHIAETHHAYLRFELPALDKWFARVSGQHPGERELLLSLQSHVQRFHRSLEIQMSKEEAVLFPAILDLETAALSGGRHSGSLFGSVANLSCVMEQANNAAGGALDKIRDLTNQYACPPDASAGLMALMGRLRSLAANVHLHLHLENNILFPRAIQLEKTRSH